MTDPNVCNDIVYIYVETTYFNVVLTFNKVLHDACSEQAINWILKQKQQQQKTG